MALSQGPLGKTSVAYERGMTSDRDVFFSCLLGHSLTSELTLFFIVVSGKEYKFSPDGKKNYWL